MSLLELKDVGRRFGGLDAVRGVEFEIDSGQFVALIGPNGAGKSTLINLITGVDVPTSGSVFFDGERVDRLAAHQVARLGMGRTFQTSCSLERMTVRENVAVGAFTSLHAGDLRSMFGFRGARRQQREALDLAQSLLERFNLAARADELVEHLPYGQLRLVEMARAMAMRPKLVCFDEPACGLNPAEVESVATMLREFRGEGVAVLLVEHNTRLVFSVAEHITVLDQGRVLARGTPEEIRANEDVVRAYLGGARA